MSSKQLGTVGVVATMVLLFVAVLVPVASAETNYAPVAGTWVGPVAWPSGSSEVTTWTIGADGTFSIQTESYTAQGSLKPQGSGYAFAYEWQGRSYKGMLAPRDANGKRELVGRGEDAYGGPMNISLQLR